ncbi:hypothetical protein HDU76_004815 [Blyttiomyces sp. JEL0837]|nr:hypothetical protein HDU76_004815 [Blyttiomyces sp. JEL0837]
MTEEIILEDRWIVEDVSGLCDINAESAQRKTFKSNPSFQTINNMGSDLISPGEESWKNATIPGFPLYVDFSNQEGRPPLVVSSIGLVSMLALGAIGIRTRFALFASLVQVAFAFTLAHTYSGMMIVAINYPQLIGLACTLRLASSSETLIRSNFKRDRILQEELLSLNTARVTMDTLLASNLPIPIIKILRETNGDFDSVTSGDDLPAVGPAQTPPPPKQGRKSSMAAQTSSGARKVSVMFCEFFDSDEENNDSNMLDDMVKVVRKINTVLAIIEEVVNKHGGELIKSMETKVLIACGITNLTGSPTNASNEETAFAIAVDLLDAFAHRSFGQSSSAYIKIGLHKGPVSSAIIGDFKFAYDVFGDTVNIASRMMSMAREWHVFMTGEFAGTIQLKGTHTLKSEGQKMVKGKGLMKIWSFTTPELLARQVKLSKRSEENPEKAKPSAWKSILGKQMPKSPTIRVENMEDEGIDDNEMRPILTEKRNDVVRLDNTTDVDPKAKLHLAVKKAIRIRSLFKSDFKKPEVNEEELPHDGSLTKLPRRLTYQSMSSRHSVMLRSDSKKSDTLLNLAQQPRPSVIIDDRQSFKSFNFVPRVSTKRGIPESERLYENLGEELREHMEDEDIGTVVDEILKMSSRTPTIGENNQLELRSEKSPPRTCPGSPLVASVLRFLKQNIVENDKFSEITSKFINKLALTYKNPRFESVYRSSIILGKNEMLGLVIDCVGLLGLIISDIVFSAISWAYAEIPGVDTSQLKMSEKKRVADEEIAMTKINQTIITKALLVNYMGIFAFSFITIYICSQIHVTFGTLQLEYQPLINTAMIFTLCRFHGVPFIWQSPYGITAPVIAALVVSSQYERERTRDFVTTYIFSMIACAFIIYSQEKWRRESYLIEMAGVRARVLCSNELERSKFVLGNTFNEPVIELLTRNPKAGLIQRSNDAAVLALDIVGFTVLSSNLTATEVVTMLNEIYLHFDAICLAEGVEKICTIGDAYIAVSGLPTPLDNPSLSICRVATQMQRIIASMNLKTLLSLNQRRHVPTSIKTRIGIYSGEVCCALIGGTVKLKYDVVGKAVELATKLEQTAVPGGVHVSKTTVERAGDACVFQRRLDLNDLINGEVSYSLLGMRDEEKAR